MIAAHKAEKSAEHLENIFQPNRANDFREWENP